MKTNTQILLLFFFILFALRSCRNKDKKEDITDVPETATTNDLWSLSYDSTQHNLIIKTLRPFDRDTLQVATVVNFLNKQYTSVPLSYLRTQSDTIFTEITDSDTLTQQMGSMGADQYLKSATYLLTDLKNIHYVSFLFPEGDHAEPGVYKREDWQ